MGLTIKNSNSNEIQLRIKDFVDKSRTNKEKTDSVYVLKCNKPKSKESAIETAKKLLKKYSTNGEAKYRDPNKKKRNNIPTRPSSFKEALDTDTSNMNDNRYISYPYWIEKCYKAEDVFYIGWSNEVEERIIKHVTHEGALFTKIFSPIKIEEIRWYPSKESAKKAEGSVAGEYSDIKSDTDLHKDRIEKYAYYF